MDFFRKLSPSVCMALGEGEFSSLLRCNPFAPSYGSSMCPSDCILCELSHFGVDLCDHRSSINCPLSRLCPYSTDSFTSVVSTM